MRISRRGERMSAYKKTVTYTQVMGIIIGFALLGIGLFAVLNPIASMFSTGAATLMTLVGMFMVLFGIMTPMGQLFNVNKQIAFGVSFIVVLIFVGLIYFISMNVEITDFVL